MFIQEACLTLVAEEINSARHHYSNPCSSRYMSWRLS